MCCFVIVTLAKRIAVRHNTTSDHMAAAQVQMGQLPKKNSPLSAVKLGDKVWLNSKLTPVDIPDTLTARWFGLFEVLKSRVAQVSLDLQKTFGKTHHKVKIRPFLFFEQRYVRKLFFTCLPPLWSQRMVLLATRSSVSPTHARTRARQNCGSSGKIMISRKIAGYTKTY